VKRRGGDDTAGKVSSMSPRRQSELRVQKTVQKRHTVTEGWSLAGKLKIREMGKRGGKNPNREGKKRDWTGAAKPRTVPSGELPRSRIHQSPRKKFKGER